jgi:hypothetical protein
MKKFKSTGKEKEKKIDLYELAKAKPLPKEFTDHFEDVVFE